MPPVLRCAGCKVPLHSVSAYGAVSWRCPQCRGAAIGLAVVRRLAPQERIQQVWNAAWATEAAPAGACPSCATPMRNLSLDGGLSLGACRGCQILWFAGDELRKFAPERQESSATPSEMTRAARDAIAIAAARGHGDQAAHRAAAAASRERAKRKLRTSSLDKLVAALLA